MLGHFSLFFRILGAFWTQLEPSSDFFAVLDDFLDFLSILGGFWDDFFVFFR